MKTLYEAILSCGSKNAPYVAKHLKDSGIRYWRDCTRVGLSEFIEHLEETGVCQATIHQYAAVLKAVLNKYRETGVVPCSDISEALRCKNEKTQKVYLTERELEMLEKVETNNDREKFIKLCFLISAKTGMRVSDTLKVGKSNIQDGYLRYVSKKTKIEACVPISAKTAGWIAEVNKIKVRPAVSTYETIIRKLCKDAGINAEVMVFKAGEEKEGEKWTFVTSHTARVTFCTLLSQMGTTIQDIATMAGHTNPIMTMNYIVRTAPRVNDKARAFFG